MADRKGTQIGAKFEKDSVIVATRQRNGVKVSRNTFFEIFGHIGALS
jgi:hypothetical protein